MSRTTARIAQHAALLFGGFLVRIAMRDIAWMTWQVAKDRMHKRALWRRRLLEPGHEDLMVVGPSGTRRIMDDDHIAEWWGEEDDVPLW